MKTTLLASLLLTASPLLACDSAETHSTPVAAKTNPVKTIAKKMASPRLAKPAVPETPAPRAERPAPPAHLFM